MTDRIAEIETRVDNGDREVIGALLAEVLPRLIRRTQEVVWGRPQSKEDAEDAAQSAVRTYLRRWESKKLPTVTDIDELYRLLAKIACRKLWKRLRRQQRQVDIGVKANDDNSDEPLSWLEELSAVAPTQEYDLLCDELLGLLPDDSQRRTLTMLLEGNTQVEIAQKLGYTERNIRNKVTMIRRRLKTQLGDPHEPL